MRNCVCNWIICWRNNLSVHPCHPTPHRFSSPQRRTEAYGCVPIIGRSTTSPSSPVTQFREPTISLTNFAGPGFFPRLIYEEVTTRFVSPKPIFRRLLFEPVMEVMPFGLANAPSTFKLTMNEVFRSLLDKCAILYLDDILVYSTSREQHLTDLEAVFTLCDQHRLIIKGSKCEFLKEELEFLGHVISTEGVKNYQKKIDTIRNWEPPTNVLGFVNYEVHDANCSGHFGVDKTLKMLQRHYYWPNASHNVQQYVASCPTCQLMKSSHQKPAGLLQLLDPPTKPWTHVSMDFVTRLSADASQNDAVLVVVDRLTKMAHFAPCRTTITAEQTAKLFISTDVRLFEIPKVIVRDRDPRFTSNFWTKMWEQYGTRLHPSTAYHPQTDGQTKRTNHTMEQLIRTTCTDLAQWEDPLPLIEFAYNNAPSSTTAPSGRALPELWFKPHDSHYTVS
ncbi:hypothetical protein CLOM_g12142 [Closterium sp. NIES-68]|nr:hypothetical protein CLOM_g12142 [Closterium sp. NIES-68]GJP79661.1 hypothetical protein CLOP_g9865 [Closterium sp. NIES-67]